MRSTKRKRLEREIAKWDQRRSPQLNVKAREPIYFVDPETGDLIEVDYSTAQFRGSPMRRKRGRMLGGLGQVSEPFRKAAIELNVAIRRGDCDRARKLASKLRVQSRPGPEREALIRMQNKVRSCSVSLGSVVSKPRKLKRRR